ncbi:MAG: alkaline phosphatase family protein [Opitutaceae bacterium]|nr:alkaline phosphatase family protein [Opitutaceae bacterium]
MKHAFASLRWSLLVWLLAAAPLFGANADRHVVLISIDGFPAYMWRDLSLPVPNLRRLAAAGATADAMTVVNPSITWINHTTLVTGVTPRKHGVLFNGLLVRNGTNRPPKIEPWVDKSRLVFAPTLYDVAHAAGLTSAEADWVAVTRTGTIDWSFAEIPKREDPVVKEMIADGALTEEEVAWMQPPNRKNMVFVDNTWTRAACYMFKKHKPNLLMYHTLNTDSTHHRYGPLSPPSYTALAYADRLVGDLIRAVDESGRRANTTFIITTDHGFKKVSQYVYPNVALKRAGLLRAAGPTVNECDAYVMTQGGIAFVYVLDPARKAELVPRLRELLQGVDGIARVIDGSEGPSHGMPTPEENQGMGDLILFPKSGFAFSASAAGNDLTGPSTNYGGTHGYPASDPELDGIFIASGAGIKPGVRLERMRNLDVAPTIAHLLGLSLPNVEGRVLTTILAPAK